MQKDATIKGKSLQSSDDNVADVGDVADALSEHIAHWMDQEIVHWMVQEYAKQDAAAVASKRTIDNKIEQDARHAADLKKQYKSFCGQDVTIPVHESNILVSHIDMDLAKIITIDGYVPPRKYVGIYKQDVTNKLSDMTTNGGK